MTVLRALPLLLLVLVAPLERAAAMDFALDGFADARAVEKSDAETWLQGGLGKFRYGGGEEKFNAEIAQILAEGRAQLAPEVAAAVTFRYDPRQRTALDIVEGFVRYRPVSMAAWRVSVKLGAFFPPISLENTDIGWTSPWTLTPSAINSWVGEELRVVGGEVGLEWRRPRADILFRAGAFGWNDPAGVLIADRGWALGDRPTGLFDHLRLPNALGVSFGNPDPMYTKMYTEIDATPGWYAGVSWKKRGFGKLEILRYDNEADPSAEKNEQYAWRTKFWSAGLEMPFGDFEFLSQAMTGETIIAPSPFFSSTTRFQSAYALLGWSHGAIRLAARAEVFGTVERHPHRAFGPPDSKRSEHGNALTVAANWIPVSYLKLTAEIMRVDSFRAQRELVKLPPRDVETQAQFNLRVYF